MSDHENGNGKTGATIDDQGPDPEPTEGELFLVHGGVLYPVPPATAVASVVVLELAEPILPTARQTRNRPEDLYAADEVFLAGTACWVIGIVRLHGRDIGTGTEGPVTRQIREAYHRLTRGPG